ncbi:MAG: GMC family oxidoreductase N-terminal domain-containing protein [Myxococcales bacterium]
MTKRAIVIGSGFGGAVTACRLAQAALAQRAGRAPGARPGANDLTEVILLERGRRYGKDDFPRLQLPESMTSSRDLSSSQRAPDFSRYSWRTDYGLFDARNLGGLMVLQAAGLGGGSLIYANVMLRAPDRVLAQWPAVYSHQNLAQYYDLAEKVLGANVSPGHYPKTKSFVAAVEGLKREVVEVPVAITFPKEPGQREAPRPNRYGKEQGRCNGCGDCVIGCTLHAKNTLDLNYLAQFEAVATTTRDPQIAQVWTMAEATHIEQTAAGFDVHLVRHDQGEAPVIEHADYVFLGAGAIGTTELLMRSRKTLPSANLDALGTRVFGNGDSLGIVFDGKRASTPWSGPTITRAMVYQEPPPSPPGPPAAAAAAGAAPAAAAPLWFMVQDGGIPPTLRRVLGYFHSGMWLGRNRFASPKKTEAVRPSFGPLTDLFLDLPVLSGIFSRRVEPVEKTDEEPSWRRYAPKDFWPLLNTLTATDGALRREIELLDQRVMDRLQSEMGRRYGLASWLPSINKIVNTSVLTESVLGAIRDRFPVLGFLPTADNASTALLKLAVFLLLGHGPSANTDVLLCMGPDHAWTLKLRAGSLRADRDRTGARDDVALYGAQERILRDLAKELHGELRTNPSWTVGQRPVTVHAQGGAGMSPVPAPAGGAVTDDWGRVGTRPGAAALHLYVMDAAGFPTSVGVNPSLTIAAVAEAKVEHFIQNELGMPNWLNAATELRLYPPPPGPPPAAPPFDRLIELQLRKPPAAAVHRAVGIRWHERMDGSAAEDGTGRITRPRSDVCVAGDKRGLHEGRHVSLELDCHIPDLEVFYLERRPTVTLKGKLEIREPSVPAPRPEGEFDCEGRLWLGFWRGRMYTMNYRLNLISPRTQARGQLRGTKFIRDDPGIDSFLDLTTLHTYGTVPGRANPMVGVVRVPLSNFISKQMPTFKLENAQDLNDTGKLWAAARFSQFFFGSLKETFLPELFVKKQALR